MSYKTTQETFHQLEKEWYELLAASNDATVFQTPSWLGTWWDHFGQGNELLLLTAREGERLVGVAPLMRQADTVAFLGDTSLCDYHDFIVLPGAEEPFLQAIFAHLCAQGVAEVELQGLRQGTPSLELVPRVAEGVGFSVETQHEAVSPSVELHGTWEEFLQRLKKKDRHELRRKLRRLQEVDPGYGYVVISDGLSATQEVRQFSELMRDSREEKREFLNPEREQFFLDLTQRLAREGLAKLYFLEVKGLRVASALCFDYRGTYYLYNSGYDQNYAGMSVGLLLKALCVKDALVQGADHFDFLRGGESYKYDLGGRDVNLYRITLRSSVAQSLSL